MASGKRKPYRRKQVQADPEILPKVLKIVELILKTKNKKSPKDVYSITFETCEKARSKKLAREYVDLITGCISNHRYKEAVKLLWMICLDKSISHVFIFKVAMIVFNNLEYEFKDSAVSMFIKAVQKFRQLNKREILLEYLMYCLKSDSQRLEDVFQNAFSSLKTKRRLRKNEEIDSILEAYAALANYINWCKYKGDRIQSLIGPIQHKAMFAYRELLFKNSGQWDIFILKLIEMMESSDKKEEIEDLLLDYLETNPNDINRYIYLCVYLYYNNPESENLIKYLEILSDKCPSDPRVLWLLEIKSKQGSELKKCLQRNFMFLDYPSNGDNILAWKLLLQNLYQASVNNNKKELKAIKHLWEPRNGSWQWMYFNPSKISHCDRLLIAHRVAILSFFDTEHPFIKETQKNVHGVADLVNSLNEQMPFAQICSYS